jgi:predicted NUDIX family NTP pyrophosphohydrolase
MVTRSAGIVLYRRGGASGLQVLVGHMGGPFWSRRHEAAWSFPKGEYDDAEDPADAARREFAEELGLPVPPGPLLALGEVSQPSGKRLTLWALEGDLDVDAVRPGTFELEWPPRSGRIQQFPEIDRAQWLDVEAARPLLVAGQRAFLDRLVAALSS